MTGNMRFANIMGTGAVGAAPGNRFPSLEGGDGFSPREWQRLQDQRYQQEFTDRIRLMNIAKRLGGGNGNDQPGNADGSPNVVYDQRPEQLAKQQKLQEQQLKENSRLKDKEIDTSASVRREGMELDRRNTEGQLSLGRMNAETSRMNATRPDIDWMDLNGQMVGVDKRNPNNRVNLGATGRMSDEAKLKATADAEAAQSWQNHVQAGFRDQRNNEAQRDIWGMRTAASGAYSPNEIATDTMNKARRFANDPRYRDRISMDGNNVSLTGAEDDDYNYLYGELFGPRPSGPMMDAGPTSVPNVTNTPTNTPTNPKTRMAQPPMIRSHQNTQRPAPMTSGRR